jgi:hypothetical protein
MFSSPSLYSAKCVEGEFSELRVDGVLTSVGAFSSMVMQVRKAPASELELLT